MKLKPESTKAIEEAKAPSTPPPSPMPIPSLRRPSRRKSPPKKLTLDDPEMPPLREVIPRTEALVSPPIMKTQKKGNLT